MHYWGDDWFQKNGKDLYDAIDFIEDNLHKYGIGVCGKEKWGCYRDDFLRLWDGGLYTILFGYRCHIGTWKLSKYPKLRNIIDKLVSNPELHNEFIEKSIKELEKIEL